MNKNERGGIQTLAELCAGKRVLEFGCGNGGFLRRIKEVASEVVGIELMDEARERISKEGIRVYKSLAEAEGKYDVICMFHVIEHLNTPDEYFKMICNKGKYPNRAVFIGKSLVLAFKRETRRSCKVVRF